MLKRKNGQNYSPSNLLNLQILVSMVGEDEENGDTISLSSFYLIFCVTVMPVCMYLSCSLGILLHNIINHFSEM